MPRFSCRWIPALVTVTGMLAAQDVNITELHYAPSASQGETEFIELFNPHAVSQDYGRFFFSRGISFVFPQKSRVGAHSHFLIARNPALLRETYGLDASVPVFGPYTGRLDGAGETIAISNPIGREICSVRYSDRGRWPVGPDGAGHTLELLDPTLDPGRVENWQASSGMGGTPGRGPSTESSSTRETVVAAGDRWRYFSGRTEPPADWREIEFSDGSWMDGASGVGYGDDDDATILDDMRGNYLSVYLRRSFSVTDPANIVGLTLSIDYDDGFVAYLNGQEIARSGLGVPGDDVAFDATAQPHEAGTAEIFDLSPWTGELVAGENLLAVQVHNSTLASNDLSILPELELELGEGAPGEVPAGIRELRFGPLIPAEDRWLEIALDTDAAVDLSGFYLSTDSDQLDAVLLGETANLAAGEFLVLREEDMPFDLGVETLRLFLSSPDLSRVVQAIQLRAPRSADNKIAGSVARVPGEGRREGEFEWIVVDEPTPGAENRRPAPSPLVITEIAYHSVVPLADPEEEFVEIHNTSASPVDLSGFKLREGVEFDFPAGTALEAGGYLVVARNPDALSEAHGLSSGVFGPFSGSLSNAGELIELRDSIGNVLDAVRYFDDGDWPRAADGGGSTLELIDARQANDAGGAWAASDESSKSEWVSYSYSGVHSGGEGEIHLLLMGRGSCFVDQVSVTRGGSEYVPNPGFDSGGEGWIIDGNHILSSVTDEDSRFGARSLHVVASGRGDPGANHIEIETVPALRSGQRYDVRFWARWESGCPLLMTRSYDQGMVKVHRLEIPTRRGTPAAPNSIRQDNLAPVIDRLVVSPTRPAPGIPISFEARVRDADGISSVALYYREDGEPTFQSVELDMDPGEIPSRGIRYRGAISGFGNNTVVEFYLEATDTLDQTARYPKDGGADDPDRSAFLFQVDGKSERGKLPNVRLITTAATRSELATRTQTSNHLLPATLSIGEQIGYRAWIRQRGCFCSRGLIHPPIWRAKTSRDQAIGARREWNLDNQHADSTNQRDRTTYLLMRELGDIPYPTSRYIHVFENGQYKKIYEIVDKVDKDFLADSFGDGSGPLFKVDGWFEFPDSGPRYTWKPGQIEYVGENAELYRWRYKNRGPDELDDFSPLIEFLRFMDPGETDNPSFDRDVRDRIATSNWLKSIALRVLVDAWDTVGVRGGKNAFLYQEPKNGRWWMLPFDNDATFGNDRQTRLITTSFPAIRRFIERPEFEREYYRTFRTLLDGPFSHDYLDPILEETYDLLRSEGPTSDPGAILGFITPRRQFVESELDDVPELRILTNSGNPIVTDRRDINIAGEAPLLAEIFILGSDQVSPRFLTITRFALDIALEPGANDLTLTAFDEHLNIVGSVDFRITSTSEPTETTFIRGDSNRDSQVDISDAIATLTYLFLGGDITCLDAGDVDDNGDVDITDAIRLLNHLFQGGRPPEAPYPQVGEDPSQDKLGCE